MALERVEALEDLELGEKRDLPGLAGYLDNEAKVRAQRGPARCECDGGSRVNPLEDDPTCGKCGRLPSVERMAA